MEEGLVLKELIPAIADDRKMLTSFLARHNLRYEEDIEYAIVLFDQGPMVACGCCAGPLLKCFAVDEEYRGQNVLGSIVSALVANRFLAGYFEPFIITPSYNRSLFTSCGFYPVAETEDLAFLEKRPRGIDRFYSALRQPEDEGKTAGAIVVNCNPFTRGHRYLVEYSAMRCELLYIFVVSEDKSTFPFDIRLELVKQGVADLPNVRVHAGGNYIISSATFPTYFLKQKDDAVRVQAELDAKVFATRIAPVLSIKTRFVGSEPKCAVTSEYNGIMHRVLPAAGIEMIEIPRITTADGEVISASRVRSLLAEGITGKTLLNLVPETTYRFLISESAIPIIKGLQQRKG